MRKILAFCAIFALTLTFAFSAVAQENECDVCKGFKWQDDTIPCPTDEQRDCYPEHIQWDKFIFPVCECPEVDVNFGKGSTVGVRMHILTEGVYWADNQTALSLQAYKSTEDACNYASNRRLASFTDILYYPDETCDPDEAYNPATDPRSLSHSECTWDERDHPKLKSLATNPSLNYAFFTIPDDRDDEGNLIPGVENWTGYSYWKVEIPRIRIDSKEVLDAQLRGESVKIRIEFVKPGDQGICAGDCLVICECVIEVKALCDLEEGCIYFPYVISQYSPWATGIAISNIGGNVPASDMKVTFTLTDKTGAKFSFTKDDFESIHWSNVLDNILGEFDGTPAAGHGQLRVSANFLIDGYQFVTDGVFGGSTLARGCWFAGMQDTVEAIDDIDSDSSYLLMDSMIKNGTLQQIQDQLDTIIENTTPED